MTILCLYWDSLYMNLITHSLLLYKKEPFSQNIMTVLSCNQNSKKNNNKLDCVTTGLKGDDAVNFTINICPSSTIPFLHSVMPTWHKLSLAWQGVLYAVTFDLNPLCSWSYGHDLVINTVKILHIFLYPLYKISYSGWIIFILGTDDPQL